LIVAIPLPSNELSTLKIQTFMLGFLTIKTVSVLNNSISSYISDAPGEVGILHLLNKT